MKSLCKLARVSRAGYYNWLLYSSKPLSNIDLLIKEVFVKKNEKAGYRTIKMLLKREHNLTINHKRILGSMRKQNLKTKIRRKRNQTVAIVKSISERAFDDKVQRGFSPQHTDEIYSGDVTEFRICTGQKIYMHAAKDLCSKEIVSYNLSTSPNVDLVLEKFKIHLKSLPLKKRKKLLYHTDQGGVFMSEEHIKETNKLKVKQSMSRRGNCLDNAPIESFFGHFKDEVDFKVWKNLAEVKTKVKEYMNYYNFDRPQWGLKGKTPVEYRRFID